VRRLVSAALALAVLASTASADDPGAQVTAALERIKDDSTIELVTTGRKSGKQHARPIWFVVDHGKVLVQAGKDGKTDWYLNIRKNREAVVRAGAVQLRVRGTPVEDEKRVAEIHRLFLAKYTTARVLSWFGSSIGRGQPVELEPLGVAER
jgi:deazaflavin-dependent oxidoreductase (nitroreductase family)